MALVKASRDAVLKPLQGVAGIGEKKNTMPILANVLIQKQGTELRFVATDTEMQVSTIAHLGGDSDDMAITVSASPGPRAFYQPVNRAAKSFQASFKHGVVCHGTTRHPLLPKWTSLSHRGQETQACCDGWTPFGLLRYGS